MLMGLAVGDSFAHMTHQPAAVSGGPVQLGPWGQVAERSFVLAEALLQGRLLDIDVSPIAVAAPAIALADPDASPSLFGDPDAVLMCSLVRSGLVGQLELDPRHAQSPDFTTAVSMVSSATTFVEAISQAGPESLAMTGALAGLRWGPAAIPAAWATTLHGPVGSRTYTLRQLRRLAERLMHQDAPSPPEPRRSLGPRQVAPKLWLSNLHAVPRFLAEHPDGAVISMCPTTGAFDHHLVRREFAVHDAGGSKVNPHLSHTVDQVLETIRAFHAEGREVLVHCHHGASRTGLILRAWLISDLGLNEEDATTEAQVRWPKTSGWNNAFNAEIRRRCLD